MTTSNKKNYRSTIYTFTQTKKIAKLKRINSLCKSCHQIFISFSFILLPFINFSRFILLLFAFYFHIILAKKRKKNQQCSPALIMFLVSPSTSLSSFSLLHKKLFSSLRSLPIDLTLYYFRLT